MRFCIVLFLLATVFSFPAAAQDYQVPQNVKLEVAEDYPQYEKDVIATTRWLAKTRPGSKPIMEKNAAKFLLQWLTGAPNVTITLNPKTAPFMECGSCLLVFMGGWATYVIESGDNQNQVKGTMAGLELVMSHYETYKDSIGKQKGIEKLIKKRDKGTLEEWVAAQIG